MKVLWFSNSPCGSIRRFSNGLVKSGGWLISLEDELKSNPDITLEVAFFPTKEKRLSFLKVYNTIL